MQLSDFIQKYKLILSIFFLIFLIIIIVEAIFYLDNSKSLQTNQSSQSQELKALEQKIISTLANTSSGKNNENSRILNKLTILEDAKVSQAEKYNALVSISSFLQGLYSQSNDPKLYNLINKDVLEYAKKNFPQYYNENYFVYSCQDPSCADSPQPPDILKIVVEIKASDFPTDVKQSLTQDLINTGYRSKAENAGKRSQYKTISNMIRANNDFSPNGQNIKISQEIDDFIKKSFPNE